MVVASKTQMALLREAVTKALLPAKTTSTGSSFTLIVSVTMPRETDTMLMLSEPDRLPTLHHSSAGLRHRLDADRNLCDQRRAG